MIQRITGDLFDVLPTLQQGMARMIFMDLPYGMTRAPWDKKVDLVKLWPLLWPLLLPNGIIVATASQPFTSELIMSQRDFFRYEWIWEKTNATGFLNAKRMPLKAHENILIFYRKQSLYNPIKTHGHIRKVSTAAHKRNSQKTTLYGDHNLTTYDSTERYPRSVLAFKTDKQLDNKHPTQKPVALLKYIIQTYSNEGDLVIDPVCGSGSTLTAARALERKAIGIDILEF